MKPTPRNSKRKLKKSYIDEDDSVQDENSNTMSEMEAKAGTVEGAEEDEDGEKIEGEQQKEVHLPHHLQALQEQIARRVNWGYVGDSSLSLQEREESKKEEEQLNNSLETVKLEMPMMKSDTSEEKETAELAVRKNKVSDAAGALLEAIGRKSAASCGCFEMFLEGKERCKENCLNRKERRECNCVPPCSNMAIQMLRQGKTVPLVKEEADRLLSTASVQEKTLLGELTGEVLTKEEMSSRLEEYKAGGMYSRVWKLGPDLRLDTEPLQRPGSAFRVAKHSCMPSALVKEVKVDGVPCLAVVASRPLAENEEVTFDLGYQLEVVGATKLCDCGTSGCRLLLGATVTTSGNVRCCSCHAIIPAGVVPLHPSLALPSCTPCRERLLSVDWEERTGENSMCRCCGSDNQAALFPCSNCPASFCKPCLAKTLFKPRLTSNWRCLLCNSVPLRNFKLSLAGGQEDGTNQQSSAVQRNTARGRASPGPVARSRGSQVAPIGGRASLTPRLRVPLAAARPRIMGNMRVMRPRMGLHNTGPRTPRQRPGGRPWMAGPRPRFISPGLNMMRPSVGMTNQTSQELNPLSSASPVSQTDEWDDPASDPLAEEPATPSLTFHGDVEQASPSLSGAPTGVAVGQDPGQMVKSATIPSAAKRPRVMLNAQGGFEANTGPRMPPGPRMWKSPALATPPSVWGGASSGQRLATRPLFRMVSKPFQLNAEVEVITVEEKEDNVGEVLLKIPSNITVVRQKDEVSLEKEARTIGELMMKVANKLAEGGGAMEVTSDVLDAQKMINSMGYRLK